MKRILTVVVLLALLAMLNTTVYADAIWYGTIQDKESGFDGFQLGFKGKVPQGKNYTIGIEYMQFWGNGVSPTYDFPSPHSYDYTKTYMHFAWGINVLGFLEVNEHISAYGGVGFLIKLYDKIAYDNSPCYVHTHLQDEWSTVDLNIPLGVQLTDDHIGIGYEYNSALKSSNVTFIYKW
jgi:hypothetical protein